MDHIWYVLSSNEKKLQLPPWNGLSWQSIYRNESISFKIDNISSVESFEIINNNTLSILFTEAIFQILQIRPQVFLNNDFYATHSTNIILKQIIVVTFHQLLIIPESLIS